MTPLFVTHLFPLFIITLFIAIQRRTVTCEFLIMGNSLISSSNKTKTLPIDTVFQFPSPLPTWPPGGGFATGDIDLGGLQVRQVSSFRKIWTTNVGGPENLGATVFEPYPIPDGFSMLGCYMQPNNQPLFGWVLVGKTNSTDQSGDILKQPTNYTLIWPNNHINSSPYFWLPTPPDGYKSVGLVVTDTPEKPSLERIRCVRADFTADAETDNLIWDQVVSAYALRPKLRGINSQPLSVGTFIVQDEVNGNSTLQLSCLMNKNSTTSATPNQAQISALFQTYAPYIYFHPDETYLPSSVNWYFSNGALLYKKGEESSPSPVHPSGSNLPQGGSNDGSYWLDLPVDEKAENMLKKGDLQSAEAYLHVKPVLGGAFTDIQVWLFYPFNGPATAKVGVISKIPLGKIGSHVGDWEHVTLRISNFDGVLYRVYFGEHSGGKWVDSCLLEFEKGNRFVGYSSLNGHASYDKAGVAMQGREDVGLRNDTARSDMVMDTAGRYTVVAAAAADVEEPAWLNYFRKWGPTRSYDIVGELERVKKRLPANLREQFERLEKALPPEIFGEDGPTGPKVKNHWSGDEK